MFLTQLSPPKELIEQQQKAQADAEAAAAKAKADAEKAAASQTAATTATTIPQPPAPSTPQAPSTQVSAPTASATTAADGLLTNISDENLACYNAVMKMLVDWKEQCKSVASEKQFKFACQKAVITPVNAISPISSSHLKDKYDKLNRLITGNPLEVDGNQFSAAKHPQGIAYCKALLAKRFVKQGEDTVSSKPESAFAFAAVILALWTEFPDFGGLILGYFYEMCPYLVPYRVPRGPNDSDQDYYKKLGYTYDNAGKVEEQNKFVKRMQGIVRLYAALTVTEMASFHAGKPHPHGLGHIWKWLASTINLKPFPDVTASILCDVLEVSGHAMFREYGQQFRKLLQVLFVHYFPKIKEVTPEGSGGPVMRLEQLLQNAISSGAIPKPDGILSPGFI